MESDQGNSLLISETGDFDIVEGTTSSEGEQSLLLGSVSLDPTQEKLEQGGHFKLKCIGLWRGRVWP